MTKQNMTIQVLRDVVKNMAYVEHKFPDVDYTQTREEEIREFGGKINGTVIDMQTANMMVTVYNALGKPQQEKFDRMLLTMRGFDKLVDFGWKQVK